MKRPDAWTAFEDLRLKAAKDLGLTWSAIAAKYLPGRTPSAAASRHAVLMGYKVNGRSVGSRPRPPLPVPVVDDPDTLFLQAIDRLYAREAERRGTTPDVVRLIPNYSPAELARMHQRAAA